MDLARHSVSNRYYQVALLGQKAPLLTYHSPQALKKGQIVSVLLKQRIKDAVILESCEKPSFDTLLVKEVTPQYLLSWQMDTARFIARYYYTTLAEALKLFVPLPTEIRHDDIQAPTTHALPTLTSIQQEAYTQIKTKDTSLLFGVTGSGKTEIFIHLIADALKQDKTALLLMPEISLTPQTQKRLKRYFGDMVAIWHSKVTKKKKEQILHDMATGKVRIIAGARSALFLPHQNLGAIIVDEEHDESYKSSSTPRYHARDMALFIGKKVGAKVLLASATPSLESYIKHSIIRLKEPFIKTQKEYRFIEGSGITQSMIYALREHLDEGNQALLFLPTRGNFKYLYCEACGKTHTCLYCSVGMTLHKSAKALKCHYCNYTEPIKESCSYCGHTPLKSDRIGTKEAKEIIEGVIEGIKIELFDSDTITTPNKLSDALRRVEKKEANLLLGTQMLSKGHDYPDITLSIITGLDHLMGLADFRARQRAMALLFQIAGRSGRTKAAEVLIQTADPSLYEPYIDDYETFLKEERIFRELALYPPFSYMARIIIAHKDHSKAGKILNQALGLLKQIANVEIVGHGKAPIERMSGKWRMHMLLRSKHRKMLHQALAHIKDLPVTIDVDPYDFS